MDYMDRSHCGNDIINSLIYNCLSWMSIFIGETLSKFLMNLGLSVFCSVVCSILGRRIPGVLQRIYSIPLNLSQFYNFH